MSETSWVVRSIRAHSHKKVLRDCINILKYGTGAPLSDMAIYPDPMQVTHFLSPKVDARAFRRNRSGAVFAGDWDLAQGAMVEDDIKMISCRMRWKQQARWEDTPLYHQMMADLAAGRVPKEAKSPEEFHERYALLDRIFAETCDRGRMLNVSELPDRFRREQGGVLLHMTRDGTCLRGGGGSHRFAIARILRLAEVPAQLGVIHPLAIKRGHLDALRRSKLRAA